MNKWRHISPRPPRWASRFLEWYCKPSLYEDLQGDLHEYFARNLEKRGATYARLVYVVDVLKFFRPYTVQKPGILSRSNHYVLFGNYFKSSVRNMARNRLFTGINVAGLAASLTVGLFMISLISELQSFDDFHQKGDRIYRLLNSFTRTQTNRFATTSILAGSRVSEEVPGVEKVVFVNDEFQKDVRAGEKEVPLDGDFASEDFFSVFSYRLLQGHTSTALKEPFSLVLTRSAAARLFGDKEALGEIVQVDGKETYLVTGIMEDVPSNSHQQFDCLASFSTYLTHEVKKKGDTGWWMNWATMWSNNVYLLLQENVRPAALQPALDKIAAEENANSPHVKIALELQPLDQIMHENVGNQPMVLDEKTVWIMAVLSLFIIVSAAFNYTNLSIARAFRRSREVGVRKLVGASQFQVMLQFLLESVLVSLLSLLIAAGLFYWLRSYFSAFVESFAGLRLSLPFWSVAADFLVLAFSLGLASGLLPAILFSRARGLEVLKGIASRTGFKGLFLRKALVIFQYTLSVVFVVGTSLIYRQYTYSLNFDLGYSTENILNVELQGNKAEVVKTALQAVPGVEMVSASGFVNSTGTSWSMQVTSAAPPGSFQVQMNYADEHYLPLHRHHFLAGRNFQPQADDAGNLQAVVNEQFLKSLGVKDPAAVVGQTFGTDWGEQTRLVVVGVVKDFHHGTLHDRLEPFVFVMQDSYELVNVRIAADNLSSVIEAIEAKWGEFDKVHPFEAELHEEGISATYRQYVALIQAIGYLAFISISIACLGLLGMVVFTTETRLKEISIRKVLGAGELQLVRLLGQGFLLLLLAAALVGVPAAWHLGQRYFLSEFVYVASFGFAELFGGVLAIFIIAAGLVASQTIKAARTNPAHILRHE